MKEKKYFWSGLFTGLLVAILVATTAITVQKLSLMSDGAKETSANSKESSVVDSMTTGKMKVIEETIDEYYMEEVDTDTLQNGVYAGMLDAIGDPYSAYYSPEELQQVMETTKGIYYGIGAYMSQDRTTSVSKITKVIPNTPAEEVGLMAEDILYKVEGEDVTTQDLTTIVSKIKGEAGTTVQLTIIRDGVDILDFDIVRSEIESPTVDSEMLENNIGHLIISEFDDITVEQFEENMASLKEQGMKSLILDLRDNPGGNLSTVVQIARNILPKGLIVYTEDKYGKRDEYSGDGQNKIDIPVIVLINGNSASAAEILAGAIRDYDMGTLLGTTTYGKGIVQRIISLSDGSAVKLTVSNYYTPNGDNIHNVGIAPDEVIEFDREAYIKDRTDNQLNRAIEILQGK